MLKHELQWNWLQTVWRKRPNGFRFLLLSNTVREICEKLFPRVKSEIRIRENFSRETWKIQNPQNETPTKYPTIRTPYGFRRCGNCERFCLSCNLSVFVSWFQQSRIRELRTFFGQESLRPPKSESARTPMTSRTDLGKSFDAMKSQAKRINQV